MRIIILNALSVKANIWYLFWPTHLINGGVQYLYWPRGAVKNWWDSKGIANRESLETAEFKI